MTETPAPLEVPETFSTTIHKNVQTITEDYLNHGSVTQEQLTWMLDNVLHLEKLTLATVKHTNSADTFIAALRKEVSDRDETIRDLNAEIDTKEAEIGRLLFDLNEAGVMDA